MVNRNTLTATVLAGFMLSPLSAAAATVINFETGYSDDQVLTDGTALLDSTGAASNVIISTENDNTMSIEATGNDATDGFINDPIRKPDVESSDTTRSLGALFLRTTSALSGDLSLVNPVFTLTFLGGAGSVSAELWDIDGNNSQGSEGWEVLATFTGGATESVLSPTFQNTADATSLNGKPWDFEFNSAANDIAKLDFIFTGTKTTGIGAAFDNLTVAQVPVPAGGLLLITGLGAFAAMRRRKAAA